jgi:hypothetical protein
VAATEKQVLSMKGNQRMRSKFGIVVVGLVLIVVTASVFAAESDPPASPEVTAAMQPYLDQYKLAGVIGIIADRNGKARDQVHSAAQQMDGR